MTIRITLYDDVAKQKHTEDFGSDIPAILYAQSKLSSLDTRWTTFKAEDVESGLVLAGPCTLAEMDATAAKIVGSSFDPAEILIAAVGEDLAREAVSQFGAKAEARLIAELGATPEEAAKVRAMAEARLGVTSGLDLTRAEEIAGQIRAAYQRISDVSWLLDSGLSDLRKAKAGYRDGSPAEAQPFTGVGEADVARRVAKAEAILQQLRVVDLA